VAGQRFALTALLSVAAALVALMALQGRGMRAGAMIAWGLAALSFAASGHATSPLRMVATAAHAAALIFWIGALPGLACVLREQGRNATGALRQFSALALPMVLVLIASGVVLTLSAAGPLSAVLTTAWGQLLAVKLGLVAGMLALALANRVWLTAASAAGNPLPLRRAIRAELVLGLVVLLLATGFRLTGQPATLPTAALPAAALSAAAPAGPMLHLHSADTMAQITLESAQSGPNGASLTLTTHSGTPLTPREVTLRFAQPSAGIEPIRVRAVPDADGNWQAAAFTLPVAGEWTLTLQLLIDDFTRHTLSGPLEILP
jgi:copper transport protein